jgi:hypothetical protein
VHVRRAPIFCVHFISCRRRRRRLLRKDVERVQVVKVVPATNKKSNDDRKVSVVVVAVGGVETRVRERSGQKQIGCKHWQQTAHKYTRTTNDASSWRPVASNRACVTCV